MFTASDVIYRHPCRILDPTSAAETARLRLQYTAVSACLDLLPPLPQDESAPHLLNLACGAGNWLLDAAYALSDAVLIGLDAHQHNIDYAHALARVCLRHNISCEVINWHEPLPLPASSFHLIHAHFLSASLSDEEWLPLLVQCRSRLSPGGILRLIEADAGHCSSPACEQLSTWYRQALALSGACLSHPNWCDLLTQAGYDVTEQKHTLDFSKQSAAHHAMTQVILMFFALAQPFIVNSGVVTGSTFEQTYQAMHWQIEDEAFIGSWQLLDLRATVQAGVQ